MKSRVLTPKKTPPKPRWRPSAYDYDALRWRCRKDLGWHNRRAWIVTNPCPILRQLDQPVYDLEEEGAFLHQSLMPYELVFLLILARQDVLLYVARCSLNRSSLQGPLPNAHQRQEWTPFRTDLYKYYLMLYLMILEAVHQSSKHGY